MATLRSPGRYSEGDGKAALEFRGSLSTDDESHQAGSHAGHKGEQRLAIVLPLGAIAFALFLFVCNALLSEVKTDSMRGYREGEEPFIITQKSQYDDRVLNQGYVIDDYHSPTDKKCSAAPEKVVYRMDSCLPGTETDGSIFSQMWGKYYHRGEGNFTLAYTRYTDQACLNIAEGYPKVLSYNSKTCYPGNQKISYRPSFSTAILSEGATVTSHDSESSCTSYSVGKNASSIMHAVNFPIKRCMRGVSASAPFSRLLECDPKKGAKFNLYKDHMCETSVGVEVKPVGQCAKHASGLAFDKFWCNAQGVSTNEPTALTPKAPTSKTSSKSPAKSDGKSSGSDKKKQKGSSSKTSSSSKSDSTSTESKSKSTSRFMKSSSSEIASTEMSSLKYDISRGASSNKEKSLPSSQKSLRSSASEVA